jgi:hypothetical protein
VARKRKGISPKVRFEVFKRDSFKCQYCGRCAPEIVLELEHIEPYSKGGTDEVLNLITSCWECNNGKGDRRLSDDAVIKKQRDQLEELQERREQLDMMLRWRNANVDLDAEGVEAFAKAYNQRVKGWSLNESGLTSARKLIKKYGLQRALEAMDKAADQVLEFKDGKATTETCERVLRYAFILVEPDDVQALYRIRARIRRRWNYVHDGIAIGLLRKVLKLGVPADRIDSECTRLINERNTSFRWWQSQMEEWIASLSEGDA